MHPDILIVEDEAKVAHALRLGFHSEGWDACIAGTGEEGFFQINAHAFDAVVLDLNLPGHDGMEILRTLRQRQLTVPVLILTARDSVEDRVRGLDAGADDYLTKPFAFAELLARMRVLLRRARVEQTQHLSFADLTFDVLTRRVSRGSSTIQLTVKESDILSFFLRNPQQILTREMIARNVWGEAGEVTPLQNVIDVHIAHLRKKVDEHFPHRLFHTIRGVGFILSDNPQ